MAEAQRPTFEAAVVDRLKESGFLEIEIRVECLVRCGEGYQDEVINAGWHYWNAAVAAQQAPAPTHISVAIPALSRRQRNLAQAIREHSAGHDLNDLFSALLEILSAELKHVSSNDHATALRNARRFGELLVAKLEDQP